METAILESGKIPKLMDMESILGRTEIGTKENGTTVLNMGKDLIYLQMETFTSDNTIKVSRKEKAVTNGRMGLFTMEHLRME